MIVTVDTAALRLSGRGIETACAIGRGGAIAADTKREGDGATPLGVWPVRAALLRRDRVGPVNTALPWRWIGESDGWSDGVGDPAYNRAVRHPHGYSAERLWRDDGLYDAIVVLGHNDAPPVSGGGSAIFLHCWNEAKPTEGCVAVPREVLVELIAKLEPGDALQIL